MKVADCGEVTSYNEGTALPGLWLALDTSTEALTIALFRDGRLVGESLSRSERNHSTRLMPAVQELLESNGARADELGGVAVGHGPGSYTGIRIGVTVAKTLAWTLSIPLIGVSSLEAMAHGVWRRMAGGKQGLAHAGEERLAEVGQELADSEAAVADDLVWVIPYMDARRGKVYTGLYAMSGGQWRCVVPDGIRLMESWLEELSGMTEQSGDGGLRRWYYFAGDGFESVIEGFGRGAAHEEESLLAVDVGILAGMYGIGHAAADVHSVVPNYTQLSEPEKKFAGK